MDELLPHEEDIVDIISEQVDHMSSSIQKLSSTLDTFCVDQHNFELHRINFLLNKYHRIRLAKIETRSSELVRNLRRSVRPLMSNLELKYLDNYIKSLDDYYEDALLSKMPIDYNRFSHRDIPSDTGRGHRDYYFVTCKKAVSLPIKDPVDDSAISTIEVEENERRFLPLSSIRSSIQRSSNTLSIL